MGEVAWQRFKLFALPGLLIVLLMSELWRQGQGIESFRSSLDVIKPVIAAIIGDFAWKLIKNEGLAGKSHGSTRNDWGTSEYLLNNRRRRDS